MGKTYVWHKKELYRLPYRIGLKYFGQIKCKKWSCRGYYLGPHRKSWSQLESMTVDIEEDVSFVDHPDTPF